jgi:hypothetical protein
LYKIFYRRKGFRKNGKNGKGKKKKEKKKKKHFFEKKSFFPLPRLIHTLTVSGV